MNGNKRVFIPTDFSIQSLSVINQLVKESSNTVFEIVLIHGYQPSNSITDLLFFSKHKMIEKLQKSAFVKAYEVIKNANQSTISSIKLDIIPFKRNLYIKNFFENSNIDSFIIPSTQQFHFESKNSFDLIPYIKKSKIPVKEIFVNESINGLGYTEIIDELFIAKSTL